MSEVNLTFKHGRTQEEARTRLRAAIGEVERQFAGVVQRSEWSADGNSVRLTGPGFQADAWVDAVEVHVVGDIPLLRGVLGGLLGGPVSANLKQLMHRAFDEKP
jgi:hypothetical protein